MKLAITAYQRPGYLQQALQSWSLARGLHRLDLIEVALEPSPLESQMLACSNHLPEARFFRNDTRLGVLENPYQALDRSFVGEEPDAFTILAEEDTVVSSDVVEYFEWASETFFADSSVLGVCAFSWEPPGRSAQEAQLRSAFCPIVWGTWKDRWADTLGPSWDHDYTSGNPPGHQSGWDWNINLRVMQGRSFVWPVQSRSDHIGKFGGTHMRPEDFPQSRAISFKADVESLDYILTGFHATS